MKADIIPIIKFEHLIDYSKTVELVQNFAKLDSNGINPEMIVNQFNFEIFYDLNIEYKAELFEFVNLPAKGKQESSRKLVVKDVTYSLNFFTDYLFVGIELMLPREFGKIEQRRKSEGKYSRDEQIGFYNEMEVEYIEILKQIQEANHLHENVKSPIFDVINEIRDYILDQKNCLDTKAKIPFSMNKVDVLNLFHKLYEARLISNTITSIELASLIQSNFYYDKDKNLTGIYKEFNEYSSGRKKSETSNTRLSRHFTKMFNL